MFEVVVNKTHTGKQNRDPAHSPEAWSEDPFTTHRTPTTFSPLLTVFFKLPDYRERAVTAERR
jgi:hypothetical protein